MLMPGHMAMLDLTKRQHCDTQPYISDCRSQHVLYVRQA